MTLKQENLQWRIKRVNDLKRAGNSLDEISKIMMLNKWLVLRILKNETCEEIEYIRTEVTIQPKDRPPKLNGTFLSCEEISFTSPFWKEYGIINTCLICGQESPNETCFNCEIKFPVKR